MTDGLKPYPEYKKSGLPWLSKIPVHWQVARNGSLFAQRNQTGFAHLPILEVSLKTGIRVRDFENSARKQVMSDFGKYKRAAKGDLAYNMMRMWQGAVGVAPVDGLVSPAYIVARPFSEVVARYYSDLFRTDVYMFEVDSYSRGIVKDRNRLYWDQFKQMVSPAPSPDEQIAIVRFLNHANRRIERCIRAKRKLIALLNEQKQAIIHRAVTRGLDANAKFKHSESRWFAEIPENCTVVTLRRVIHSAIDGPHFSPRYLDHGTPFLSARNVKADRWSLEDAKFIGESDYHEFSKRVRPEVGDVLYTKGGTTGVARVVDLTFPFQVWVHIAILKLKRDSIYPEYLALVLNSARCYEQAQLFTRGATNQDLGLGRMKNIELPVLSSIAAQRELVETVTKTIESQDSAIRRTEREIALIREYRTRLVADVVTGQLDVRAAAAKLLDESEDLEPLDDVETSDESEGSLNGPDLEENILEEHV